MDLPTFDAPADAPPPDVAFPDAGGTVASRALGRRELTRLFLVLASVAFAPNDGQAANFEVFMLPSMTAAVLFARRGRGTAAGIAVAFATLAKQTGAATLLPVAYLLARGRGKRGIAAVA